MLLLRTSLIFALGLSVNTTMASDSLENTLTVYSQGEQPLLLAKRRDGRQRGECGISPTPWALNLCKSNTFCYVSQEQVSLWLPEDQRSKGTVRAVIENTQSGAETKLSWRSWAPTLAWPTEKMPLSSEDVSFSIELKKRRESVFYKEIFLYPIPAYLQTNSERADWMKDNGCTSQADRLLEAQMT